MSILAPRAVFVTRETDYELLLARHATREQARFFLESRGQQLAWVEERHNRFHAALQEARNTTPAEWRQALVKRADLDRFLFSPEDIIVAVGQDGLVANVAKYLAGQPVIGVNPLPDVYDGVLVKTAVSELHEVMEATLNAAVDVELRTMAEAVLENGERLLALNELFIGHRSHQSARYEIRVQKGVENQSSSGLICATGTGATGWARSIMEAIDSDIALNPEEPALAFFVREPFPSIATGTSVRCGKVASGGLQIVSRMNEGGVIFADGIEQDFVAFDWGRQLTVQIAQNRLRLVAP
jgi:NAD kinase